MRFLSFDDAEPGVIAIGGAPLGIIAIGLMPVGVIAIGVAAAGVVSVACGVGAGAITFSCGFGFGGWVRTVGSAFGLRASAVGGEMSVLPEENDPFPRAAKNEGRYERADAQRVELAEIGPRAREAWARIEPTRSDETKPWTVVCDGEEVALEPFATVSMTTWDGVERPLLAHVKSAPAAPGGEGSGYREAATPRYSRRIDEILFPSRDRGPESAGLGRRKAWWIARHAFKSVAFLGVLAVVGFLLELRLSELDMTHTATVSWAGKLTHAEGMVFPSDSTCTVTAHLRTDGKSRARAQVEVTCGTLSLYRSRPSCDLTESPVPETRDHFVYALSCRDEGRAADDDDKTGQPSLSLDTSTREVKVERDLPQPFYVEITLDPKGTEVVGVPLFEKSAR